MQKFGQRRIVTAILICCIFVMLCCGSTQNAVHATGSTTAEIDQVAQQVLLNIGQNGWNDQATIHHVTTGGLYINWRMDNPSITNRGQGMTSQSHDILVDLAYFNDLAQYKVLHPQDHSYDQSLQRMVPLILSEYANYNTPKGFVYFYLLRDSFLLGNSQLLNAAITVAYNFYSHWYDPKLGFIVNKEHSPEDYDIEHALMCGAALLDAGKRFGVAAWMQAGSSTINHILAAAINPTYYLFYNTLYISADGSQQVSNYQAKASNTSSAVEALIYAYKATNNASYLAMAGQILHALFSSNLWDATNKGFYFAIDMQQGKVLNKYKETRGQSHALIALEHYNRALMELGQPQQLLGQQQDLIDVLTSKFYQSTYHGYFYRMTPTYDIYTSAPGQGIGLENYFTTEAMGTALDALQQTELAFTVV